MPTFSALATVFEGDEPGGDDFDSLTAFVFDHDGRFVLRADPLIDGPATQAVTVEMSFRVRGYQNTWDEYEIVPAAAWTPTRALRSAIDQARAGEARRRVTGADMY